MLAHALLFSQDAEFAAVFRDAASALSVELLELEESQRFADLASRQPFDLLIIDCDRAHNGTSLLWQIKVANANRDAVVIAATGGENDSRHLMEYGASMPIQKPLKLESARKHLRAALPVVVREHRRYNRHSVTFGVVLRSDQGWQAQATSLNLSEGGILLELPYKINAQADEVLTVSFTLPGATEGLELHGKLAWLDCDLRAGVRFVWVTTEGLTKVAEWLRTAAQSVVA
jgi:DNA-binding response OmpR family regulator